MKRLLCCLLAFLLAATAVPVSAQPPSSGILCSIYDDTSKAYLVENTVLSSRDKPLLFLLFDLMVEEQLITEYVLLGDELESITLPDGQVIQTTGYPANLQFSVKRNGMLVPVEERMELQLEDGDIVEWIYGRPTNVHATPEDKPAEGDTPSVQTPGASWSAQAQQAMRQGANFLNLHREESSSYIMAMSCAGQTADVATVSAFLASVRERKGQYETPTDLSRDVLLLTFSGYDAGETVAALADYQEIDKQGLFGPVNALIAYDCKQYPVAEEAKNGRQALIGQLLAAQHESGGFGLTEDDVDSTAMALTALAPYREDEKVAAAITAGVEYLVSAQDADGEFGYQGSKSCESLCQVIIALASLNMLETEARFQVNGTSLVERLLSYANQDGGFASVPEGASEVMATEQAVIALSAVKRNGSPYQVAQNLVLQQQPGEQTFLPLAGHGEWDVTVLILTLLVAAAVIGVSFLPKKKGK